MGQHPQRGPVFSQDPTGQVPSSYAQPDLSSPTTTTSLTPQPLADQPEEEDTGGKKRKPKKGGYVCHVCEKKRDRKPDLEGHLWNAHRIGDPIQCNIEPCHNKDFSTRGALKLHIKTQHNKKHEHKCKDYYFGSESRLYLIEHRIRQHGIRMRKKDTKELIIYFCPKCGKVCKEAASRQKHILRGMCKVEKKIPCPDCIRKFKTVSSRDKHRDQLHNPRAKVWECPTCTKQMNSYTAYLNHQKWHRGYNSKVRQIKAREKKREQAQLRAYAKLFEKRKPKSPRQGDPDYAAPTTKSAPAKVLNIRHSPRLKGQKGQKKSSDK